MLTRYEQYRASVEQWDTQLATGLAHYSQSTDRSVLLNVQVVHRRLAGESYRDIAASLGVSHQRIRQREAKLYRCIRAWWAQTGRHTLPQPFFDKLEK
jgi:DNA-directed RNA polymerase sigma subunit (sigma70/sigma32)